MFKKGLHVLMLCITFVESRTIKTKILTNENGTKEMVVDNGGDVPRGEIDFLIRDLNHMNISVTVRPPDEEREQLKESILMKHWNTLTEFAPTTTTEPPPDRAKKNGRRIWSNETDDDDDEEEEEEEATEAPEEKDEDVGLEESNGFVGGIQFVFQCAKEHSLQNGLLRCIATRIRSLIYPLWRKFDDGVDYYLNAFETCPTNGTDVAANTERAFYHRQRRFLYHVVLPLLVVVLIKYLIALPFLLFGVFAAKSLLLGLFSAGTASLHSLAKKYEYLYPRFPMKRYRQVQGVDGLPAATTGPNAYWPQMPWSVPEDGRGLGAYESYNM
ncbi:UNVERIFIED_CONTAM: hypothetical protein PYX00_004765 [Menopon gallinae]|uniref:Uncharacterized protein n=1 Tax=Menopon gallinae TaxID=328185 RepID=A0AAW2I6P1_9NEOP